MTTAAELERERDREGPPAAGPSPRHAIEAAMAWLGRAQECSRSRDGGVARHYGLLDGWSSSYPETTGYIIPTMIGYARAAESEGAAAAARARARRMLDWLVSIQFPTGAFQGGRVDERPVRPVTFNTGQILLGLAAGVAEFGDVYLEPMTRAGDWLASTQDHDGCWRRYPTPFAAPGVKSYEAHVAWGLLEADRIAPNPEYRQAALANLRWVLTCQRPNGWFDNCCLLDPSEPLTHTLGYVLRGVIEGYRRGREPEFLEAARRTADAFLGVSRSDGFLAGRHDDQWRPTVSWACLTGISQIAACWLLLHEETGDPRYLEAAGRGNAFVRRTMVTEGPADIRGGIKGSFPVDGDYCSFEYISWACKFFVDAQMMELAALGHTRG